MEPLSPHIEELDAALARDAGRERFQPLDVCIGDLPCRLWLDAEYLFEEAKKKYHDFLSHLPPAFELFIAYTALGAQDRFAQTIESASVDARHYVFRWDFGVRADLARGVTHALLHYNSPGSVDSILRICYALYSLSHSGVMFHSASVRLGGEALALVGGTGRGKSELSERLGAEVFSDELTMIRECEDTFWLYGTPFHGMYPKFKNAKAPVSCVVALREEGETPSIDTQGAAVRFLMKHAFFFGDAPGTSALLLGRITRLVQSVPVRGFLFDRPLRSLDGAELREVLLDLCKTRTDA